MNQRDTIGRQPIHHAKTHVAVPLHHPDDRRLVRPAALVASAVAGLATNEYLVGLDRAAQFDATVVADAVTDTTQDEQRALVGDLHLA